MIPLMKVALPEKDMLLSKLGDVFDSGILAEGDLVYEFEKKFQSLYDYNSCYAMSSGTACLHAALTASGVMSGDEVITTSMTAEPTNLSILYSGGVPIFADVDDAGNLAAESIKAKITPKTKAIVVVHYAGYPVNITSIRKVADDYGLKLIEDCAHALGAKWDGKPVGSYGEYSIFSFQAIKHMTTIDGGILVVNTNENSSEYFKKFRWFGMLKGADRTTNNIESIGYKYNMTNVSAAIGLLQLDNIENRIAKHVENADIINSTFNNSELIRKVEFDSRSEPSYWLYSIRAKNAQEVIERLQRNGFQASKLHRPNHLHKIFKSSQVSLPRLDCFYQELVHIPCGWWMSSEDVERMIEVLNYG